MSEAMTQEDAMKMDNRQATEILKPLRDMMIDQNGCPVSSAVFALDKGIEALTADVRENVKGRWVEVVDRTEMYDKEGVKTWGMLFQCNQCGFVLNAIEGHTGQYNYCPNCGAQMVRGES